MVTNTFEIINTFEMVTYIFEMINNKFKMVTNISEITKHLKR